VTFEDDQGAYDQKDAQGFIKLNALRLRTLAMRKRKAKARPMPPMKTRSNSGTKRRDRTGQILQARMDANMAAIGRCGRGLRPGGAGHGGAGCGLRHRRSPAWRLPGRREVTGLDISKPMLASGAGTRRESAGWHVFH
jgi:hypothetical protein